MNDVWSWLAFLVGAAYLIWIAAVLSRRVNRHYGKPGEER